MENLVLKMNFNQNDRSLAFQELAFDLYKSVDETSVNFDSTFTYSINVAFSGIEGTINSAQIKDFIPSNIEYTLPPVNPPLIDIREESAVGGTNLVFDFGAITDLGISTTIQIACKFKLGTVNNTSFTNTSYLYINDAIYSNASANPVVLNVNADFVLEKLVQSPSSKSTYAGGSVIYKLTLKNLLKPIGSGDGGASISNVVITDVLPEYLTVDTSYPPQGNDASVSKYADTRYDGRLGTIEPDGSITFTLPDYHGIKYEIVFVANVDINAPYGNITNTAQWEIDGVSQTPAQDTVIVSDPIYSGTVSKRGPKYAQIGNYIRYDINIGNDGNQDLINNVVEEDIPSYVGVYSIKTGSLWIPALETYISQSYTIDYEINGNGTYITLGTYNTQSSQTVNLPSVGSGNKITKLRWNIGNIPVSAVSASSIFINGTINSAPSSNQITNTCKLLWNDAIGQRTTLANATTNISNLSELNGTKTRINGTSGVIPGETIRYRIGFNAHESQVNNPIITDLLPPEVEYVGNVVYWIYDYFDNVTMDSTNPNFSSRVSVLPVEVIPNFEANRTLIRFKFNNFSLRQGGRFRVEFDVVVKPGYATQIVNRGIIGNRGNNGVVATGYETYTDIDDRDGDGVYNEPLAYTNTTRTNILLYASLSSDKKVKGALDTEYTEEPNVGMTYQGGSVDYKLTITNVGNIDIQQIEIVDILPHIGDTGVILVDDPRLSEFPVYLTENISAYIIDTNGSIVAGNIYIQYSESYDPVRFSNTIDGPDIGIDNDWSSVPPSPIVNAKSFKIITNNTLLKPNQSLVIDVGCVAPYGVDSGLVAWNSFAIKASYLNSSSQIQYLLPVEPEKVGVTVVADNPNKVKIGDFVWMDINYNGYYDDGEVGINGIVVELYDENLNLIQSTTTSNDSDNNPGFYIFNNLDPNKYYIKFVAPEGEYYTKQQLIGGSKGDPAAGFTNLIDLTTAGSSDMTIDEGISQEIDIMYLLTNYISEEILANKNINILIKQFAAIVGILKQHFEDEIASITIDNCGYISQTQRLVDILNSIKVKLNYLEIPEQYCNNDLSAHVMTLLTQNTLQFIDIVEIDNGLNRYYEKCQCIGTYIFNGMMGVYINNITKLGMTSEEWNKIAVVVYNEAMNQTQSYVPVYYPRTNSVPPINNNRRNMKFACAPCNVNPCITTCNNGR